MKRTQQKLNTSLTVHGCRLPTSRPSGKASKRFCSQYAVIVLKEVKFTQSCERSPLFAAPVDPRWFLGRCPEDGLEDGNILLEEDR